MKPKGSTTSVMFRVFIKLARQEAMWSKSSQPGPSIIDCKIEIKLNECINVIILLEQQISRYPFQTFDFHQYP